METYETESKKLIDWAMDEIEKIDEAVRISGFKGHDGPGVEKQKEITKKFKIKLAALKRKYGKEITVHEPLPQNNIRYASGK